MADIRFAAGLRRPAHVCFVAPTAWPILTADHHATLVGGAEVQQCLIARELVRRGHTVSMVCADYGQAASTAVDGIRVERISKPGDGLPGLRFFHPRLTGMWKTLARLDADIYYQRSAGETTGFVALFAKLNQRRFIYAAAHDLDVEKDRTHELFQRRAGWRDLRLFTMGVRLADAVVVQHAKQAEEFRKWYGRQPVFIPSGYKAPADARCAADGVVLWVSTLRDWKRPELFLELARRLPQLRFRMIGGPASDDGGQALFDRIAASARSLPNLEFIGFVPHARIEAYFNEARVLVNTSVNEGFPNTFLQAWARSMPTVSFCRTGSILDGHPVDTVVRSVDEMASALEHLMQCDIRWSDAGRRARRFVERHHTVDVAVTAYERLFDTLEFNRPADALDLRPMSAARRAYPRRDGRSF